MKKILKYIVFVAFLGACIVSCSFPEEKKHEQSKADGLTITPGQAQDNAFVFTITPKGEPLYYSCIVVPSGVINDADIVPERVYRLRYDSFVYGKIFNFAENKSMTVNLEGLSPFTKYDIFAVASSKTGAPGEVVKFQFMTTDNMPPQLTGAFEFHKDTLILQYNELLKLGNQEINVKKYAEKIFKGTEPLSVFNVPVSSLRIKDNYLSIISEEFLTPGAIFAISLPQGVLTDNKGNLSAPIESRLYVENNNLQSQGVVVQTALKPWDIPEQEYSVEKILKENRVTVMMGLPETNSLAAFNLSENNPNVTPSVKYIYKNLGSSETITSPDILTPGDNGKSLNLNLVGDKLKMAKSIIINIPANAFLDIYGNPNNSYSVTINLLTNQ